MQFHKLSSTSAMVLLGAGADSYPSEYSKQFFSLLNLDEGKDLWAHCSTLWPKYPEGLRLRKYAIQALATSYLQENSKCRQVVILASGLDPLGLEILSSFPKHEIYESDIENMNIKAEIYNRILKNVERIQFVSSDLNQPQGFLVDLENSGWDPDEPTLFIMEGISYYLDPKIMWENIKHFQSSETTHALLMDYLKPADALSLDAAKGMESLNRYLRGTFSIKDIRSYSDSDIENAIAKLGGKSKDTLSSNEIEFLKKGGNEFFLEENDSPSQITLFEF